MRRIGVDIGGTHTDIVVIDDDKVRFHKVSSNNLDPTEAVLRGLDEMDLSLTETEFFAHGTTVAINAVIQRKGVPTGLLTTVGFRDVLQIRRTTRGELYDFQWDPPAELTPRRWRREVAERISADGKVQREVDIEAALREVRFLLDEGVSSLAIAFLNSYRNPQNERRLRDSVLAEFPDLPVYISSDLLPAWREFERTSTAVVGGYVGPVLTKYLRGMDDSLSQRGYRSDLLVMQSNGGLGTAGSAIENPVSTLMSGPAAGVIAQIGIAGSAGIADLVGMDIGGTSTDISVVIAGAPRMRSEFDIEFGTVVGFPMIDINSIAAGGGTIAWLDQGSLLHSGPHSAGAVPGPVCYRKGGDQPTLTDAYVVTGRLNRERLLGGRMTIDASVAEAAMGRLGERIGLSAEATATGVITLTASNISAAIREMTVERGVNPRDLTLVAYGGGGPTLACDVADDLEIPAILVPPNPGLTSALGLLLTDIRHDYVRTFLRSNDDAATSDVQEIIDELIALGDAKLQRENIQADDRRFALAVDLRYVGQTHELTVGIGDRYTADIHSGLSEALRLDHLKQFGHAPDGVQAVEIVNIRVAAIGRTPRTEFADIQAKRMPLPVARRSLNIGASRFDAPVYSRESLGVRNRIAGPAIIEQIDTTTIVMPCWSGTVLPSGSILLKRESAQ